MKNPLKEKLMQGEAVIGTFAQIGHPDITEWLSKLGLFALTLPIIQPYYQCANLNK